MQKTHQPIVSTGHRRVNVSLSAETLALLDRITKKGDRSALLNKAVKFYVSKAGARELKRQLKEGAIARADRDLALAREWFPLSAESWPEY